MKIFDKILIANRGEIASRIIRTARNMGIATVAIYSEADADSGYVAQADEAWCLGNGSLSDTYLNSDAILEIARLSGAVAIHPGYGFLSENPSFAEACEKNGIVFIGPSSQTIRMMGNKIEARAIAGRAGLPLARGYTGDVKTLLGIADDMPYPVLVKAAAGGGGKGMRIVRNPGEMPEMLERTSSEALSAFKDGTVYIEQYIEQPRHIEVQIFGDQQGNVVHLFERECTLQRRYQKIVEEAPSPTLNPQVREKITSAAVSLARSIGYCNAGTIEFLMDAQMNFYFLEMNTRIQVEHPVTEMVTGFDLVEEQIRVASGFPLSFRQEEITLSGHSMECRVYAEDPARDFMPAPGSITLLKNPSGKGIRLDTAYERPGKVHSFFDPMIAKLIVHAPDREQAMRRMEHALGDYFIQGIQTNIAFLNQLMQHPEFKSNKVSTSFVPDKREELVRYADEGKEKVPEYVILAGFLLYSLHQKQDRVKDSDIWSKIGFWRLLPRLRIGVETNAYDVMVYDSGQGKFRFELQEKTVEVLLISQESDRVVFSLGQQRYTTWTGTGEDGFVLISYAGYTFRCYRADVLPEEVVFSAHSPQADGEGSRFISSPMPGKIIRILVAAGQKITRGETLAVVESMKMENSLKATTEGEVKSLFVKEGEMVDSGKLLIEIQPAEETTNNK